MKIATIFATAILATAPALATAENNCPPAAELGKISNEISLVALDIMSTRSNLAKAGLKPEAIGTTEADLADIEQYVRSTRAWVGYCNAKDGQRAIQKMAGK